MKRSENLIINFQANSMYAAIAANFSKINTPAVIADGEQTDYSRQWIKATNLLLKSKAKRYKKFLDQ